MKLMEILEKSVDIKNPPPKKRTFLKIKKGKYKNQLATYAGIHSIMPGKFVGFIPALGIYTYLGVEDIVLDSLRSLPAHLRRNILSLQKDI